MATANVKISQLPSLNTMTNEAIMPVVAGGTTYQITGANLSNYFSGGGANTGNVTFSDQIVIGTGISNLVSGLYLAPSSSSANAVQYLRVRGDTTYEPTHIHFDTGNNQYFNQFIGDDNKYVLLSNTGSIVINTDNYAGNTAQWNFDTSGKLTLPDSGFIQSYPGTGSSEWTAGPVASSYISLASNNSNSYMWVDNNGAYIATNWNSGAKQWTFGTDGKITLPNGASLNDTSGDSVAFGQNAGLTSQAQHAVAIGRSAGSLYQGEDSIAIGDHAGYQDQHRGVAIGFYAGSGGTLFRTVSDAQGGSGPVTTYVSGDGNPRLYVASTNNIATNQLVFGNNIQTNTVVTAVYPGEDRVDINQIITAPLTAGDTLTFVSNTIGINDATNVRIGMRVTGTNIPANTFVQSTGCSTVTLYQFPTAPLTDSDTLTFTAGQGSYAVAVGYHAGLNFQDDGAVAIGYQAGRTNQSTRTVAVGQFAGYSNQSANAVAVGESAGQFTQNVNAVAVGYRAGENTQGPRAVAIGEDAGRTDQGEDAVAVGQKAGQLTQGQMAIAIGNSAGYNAQSPEAVAIGFNAGAVSQLGFAVAIGANAASYNQGSQAVAVGRQAGQTSQSSQAVAIGDSAGQISQGTYSLALGYLAGANTQGGSAVAVGYRAGEQVQGPNAVAIGDSAGYDTQGISAVAFGKFAGYTNQGPYAVAIGWSAGYSNQGNNSIIINATGANLDQTTANTFTVAPVRNDVANVAEILFYNTASKEITYGNTVSVTGNITGGNLSAVNLVINSISSDDSSFVTITDGLNVEGDVGLSGGNVTGALIMETPPTALVNLTAVAGGRAFINDANLVAASNFGQQVGSGGSNVVPVWSDGVNWYIG